MAEMLVLTAVIVELNDLTVTPALRIPLENFAVLAPSMTLRLEIVFAIAVTPNNRIIIHFGKSVAWVGMTPDEARQLATLLEYRADQCEKGVTVELPDGI